MAKYEVELRDIYFNLFEYLKVQDNTDGFEEQDLRGVVDEYEKFVAAEIFPAREEADHVGVKLTEKGVIVPECIKSGHKKYYENGWMGLGLPEEIGGIPVPSTVVVACDSMATGAHTPWSMYPSLSKSAMSVILKVGSQEQKDLFVPKIMSGEWGGTMCLTEANAGSDVGNLSSIATPNDKGSYNIKGVKIFISSGDSDLYENNIHLVLAKTPGAPEGSKGLSLFIVPKTRINTDGTLGESNDVICTKIEEKMGLHCSATCELTFGQNNGCEGFLLGNEFDGMANMFIMMNEARLYCGIQGESQGNLAYLMSVQYAKERSQFGQEIINHPDIRRMLLKLRAMGRGMRALSIYVGSLFDEYEKNNDKAVLAEIGLLTPVCKAFFTEEGVQMAIDAIQIHGGYGYCTEYGIEQFLRDAKVATIYEGTNAIQALDYVMRKILKDEGKTFLTLGEKMQKTLDRLPDEEMPKEKRLLTISIGKAGEIATMFAGFAKNKQMDRVLTHATDFLTYSSNVAVAWILLEQALLAKEKLGEDSYYQTKIDDFKIFARHYLTRNIGISKAILGDEVSILSYSL